MRVVEGGEWNVLSDGRLQPLSVIDQTVSSETPPRDKHMGVSDRLQARFTQLQTTPSDSHWRQRSPPGAASSPCRCQATDKTNVRTNDQYHKQNINPGALGGLNGLVSWLMTWLTDDQSVKHFQTKMSYRVRLWLLQVWVCEVPESLLIVLKVKDHSGKNCTQKEKLQLRFFRWVIP